MPTCLPSSPELAQIQRRMVEVEARRRGLLWGEPGGRAPESLVSFVTRVRPRYVWYRHCRVLADVLQRVADGEIRRLMIFMPPRHGKSELTSRLFAAYHLYRHPERWVAIASYGAELAWTLSRAARANFRQGGGLLNPEAKAVDHWETLAGGGMWATGARGPATGKGFHLGIVDDPVKDAAEAASETIRRANKEWWHGTWSTREEPDAAQVVIQTRWHEDDLSGWLLAEEDGEAPEGWHIVSFPAIAEEPDPERWPATCTVELDWREPGAALCPERYPMERLLHRQAAQPYYFAAEYQQNPRPAAGTFFLREWFRIVDAAPAVGQRVRYWDKAGTDGGGKFTCGVRMLRAHDGLYYVEDVIRGQWAAPRREEVIKTTAQIDPPATKVWVEQEPGSGGKESAEATIRNLAGYVVDADRVTGDKAVRAEPLSVQFKAGNVLLVKAAWNRGYIEELVGFPNATYSDQVDASSGAFNKLAVPVPGRPVAGGARPMVSQYEAMQQRLGAVPGARR